MEVLGARVAVLVEKAAPSTGVAVDIDGNTLAVDGAAGTPTGTAVTLAAVGATELSLVTASMPGDRGDAEVVEGNRDEPAGVAGSPTVRGDAIEVDGTTADPDCTASIPTVRDDTSVVLGRTEVSAVVAGTPGSRGEAAVPEGRMFATVGKAGTPMVEGDTRWVVGMTDSEVEVIEPHRIGVTVMTVGTSCASATPPSTRASATADRLASARRRVLSRDMESTSRAIGGPKGRRDGS